MKVNFICILSILGLSIVSCKKSEYNLYSGPTMIQFGPDTTRIYQNTYSLNDTLKKFTFVYDPSSHIQDTIWFDIYVIGPMADHDRTFTIYQTQDTTAGVENATPGIDYIAFDDPSIKSSYTVKAGQLHMLMPVVMLRAPELKNKVVNLLFYLKENENFKLGETNNLWRKLSFTDMLIKPISWDYTVRIYYGKYSMVKHQFMIDVTLQKWDEDFCKIIPYNFDLMKYYQLKCQSALANYNKNNPGKPLKDENDNLVTFP